MKELLSLVGKGDNEALFKLQRRYDGLVHTVFRCYTRDPGLLDDLRQELWILIWKKADSFQQEKKLSTWLATIARNLAYDRVVRGKRRKGLWKQMPYLDSNEETFLSELLPARELVDPKELEYVYELVQSLPTKIRTTCTLVYFEGRKFRQAARELSVPLGTIRSRISAGLKRMREILREQERLLEC